MRFYSPDYLVRPAKLTTDLLRPLSHTVLRPRGKRQVIKISSPYSQWSSSCYAHTD